MSDTPNPSSSQDTSSAVDTSTGADASLLHQAQQLVEELQAADAAEVKAGLTRLSGLLKSAITAGEGQEAAAIRQQLDDLITSTGSFNSLMVHEIRKPMTSIRGYTDMLAKPGLIGPMNDMQQQFIDVIRTNIIRMEGLVTDISDINKLRSGRIKLDNKMTTFGQIIMDVQKQIEPLVTEMKATVTWDVPQGMPLLTVDAKQVAKVIVNLVRNAIQYTPDSGAITVKAERLDGNILRVSVTDSGIGMKDTEIARLGEVFYRADHEVVTSQKGYGLGVPIAMGFLQLMNSKLEVESVYGQGSTFSFTLAGMG